ncbi:MAG: UDP-2,3-diacylglucosamine diphosphatase LpxI [Alphaproteobacteria bacterium]|nr:UDP-2,3-diacylglucosamine diphosphatase LpxI [Alphaproteobacteria bacterium]
MPASQEKQLEPPVKRLGIIAGGGYLPLRLVRACGEQGIEAFIVAFEGQTDPCLVHEHQHIWTRLGAAGTVLSTLRAHEITDIVLIGSIRRPSLAELRPDLKTVEFFTRIGLKALGDSDLLSTLRALLENEGFRVHGIHEFATNLLAAEGVLGKIRPGKADWIDIRRGIEITQNLGGLDIGQAAIVQEGIVLGVEAAEGTDELIRRCKHLKRKGRGGVLVKMCKPQQDRDLDLPTIGPETLRNAVDTGLSGIAVHAGHSLLLDPEEVAKIADKHKLFVIALSPDNMENYA